MKSGSDPFSLFLSDSFTPVAVDPPVWRLDPADRVFLSGSCFAGELRAWGSVRGMAFRGDPFGPIYNPHSLEECFNRLLSTEPVRPEELTESGGVWNHPLFHTIQSGPDRQETAERLSGELAAARRDFLSADVFCLTLGNAWCWRRKDTGRIVNNCHKMPGSLFDRVCLSVEEASASLERLIHLLERARPGCRIVLTLSPVRSLRDDAVGNFRGKAVLRCALEPLRSERVWYFPAWEIMMDELRDYRWYGEDRIHPSARAVGYVVQRFSAAAGNSRWLNYVSEADRLYRECGHRVRFPGSPEAERFLAGIALQKNTLKGNYPELADTIDLSFQPALPGKITAK